MRLHRITLKNYRGVEDCTVEFPEIGVTVVEGNNEVGKTCIPEAVNMILSEMDSSGKRSVKAIRPVHRDEGPEVEIEVSTGDYRFTYFKRWLKNSQTTLDIIAPHRDQLAGREAHERVEGILQETLDQDLWKALSIEQSGNLNLPKFEGQSLGQALDLAAGGDIAGASEDNLWERIRTERERYWTPKGQIPKERQSLHGDLEQAEVAVSESREALRAIESDAAEVASLENAATDLVALFDQHTQTEQELSGQWESAQHLHTEAELQKAAHTAASDQHTHEESLNQRREETKEDLASITKELKRLETRRERAAPQLALAVQNNDEAATALNTSRSALRSAEEAFRQASNDRDFCRNLIEQRQLSGRYERVKVAQEELKTSESILDASKVDDDLVVQLEQANIAVAKARAALDSSAASVEATAMSPMSVTIDGELVDLEQNGPYSATITDDWELTVPDVIHVKVQPGTGSRDLAAELVEAEKDYGRLCSQGSVSNLDEARQKKEERRDAERLRSGAIETIKQDLDDLTPDVLAQKLEGLTRRIDAYPVERPEHPPLPNDLDEAKRIASHAERVVEDRKSEFEQCETNADEARQALLDAQSEEAAISAEITGASGAQKRAKDKLEADRGRISDHELDQSLATAKAKLTAAQESLRRAEEELQAQDLGSIEIKLDNVRSAKARAESDLSNNRDRQNLLRGGLEVRGSDGQYTDLNDAMSHYEHLNRAYEATESRAEATRLLYETFERRRQEASQHYAAPFKERIEQFGRIVFGPSFEAELDDTLKVARRTLEGITLDIDQLSVGAREQIGVICRLACASIVSPDGGGAPVMIDDALGWSDPTRLQSIGAAIALAGQDCQVIVLTCTPGRYAHVGNATVVRLPT